MRLDASGNWLESVRRVPSPNCDERPKSCKIELLVIHGISLPPGEFGGDCIDALFTNRLDPEGHPYFRSIHEFRVSAHVLIRRDGIVTQYVPFRQRAWHAGESRFRQRRNCNDFSIGVELEGVEHLPYEDRQYRQLAALSSLLIRVWPGITPDRIVGHCDIASGRKTDPGPAFDWGRFRGLLLEESLNSNRNTPVRCPPST